MQVIDPQRRDVMASLEEASHAKSHTKKAAHGNHEPQLIEICGGDEGTRTPDLLHAKQALFQLSYIPTCFNYGGLCPDVKHI